jgi:hypothetical protein
MSRIPAEIDKGARMTRVTILREDAGADEATYRAVVGNTQAAGRTAGEAVDALAARLPEDEGGTLLIVRDLRPDRFFTVEQRRRLEELMGRWRAARDAGGAFPAEEFDELQRLVDAEIEATAQRADEAWRELSR